jgi:hypothetical protein
MPQNFVACDLRASASCSSELPPGCRTSSSPAASGISEKTVKAHLTRIYQAIGATDRTQAALWVQRNGFG